MGIYEELGVTPIINATGVFTRLGGSLMPPEVIEAMVEASRQFVCIEELQQAASRAIAEVVGTEAGYVCSGCYAGIVLSIAGCITGLDPAKMNRLPNTEGMKNEVVMEKAHRNSYDHAVEIAGGKIVEAGLGGGCQPGELEAALTDRTAAIFLLPDRPGDIPLRTVVEIAHRHGVPVVVDAAGRLDEPSCLQSYSATGADLVVFSCGKWMAGPQAAGIIAGPARLISAIALQHLDVDVTADVWAVPRELVPVEKLPFIPRQGIGRGFKVGKEEIVGAIVALRLFAKKDHAKQREIWADRLHRIVDNLGGVPHIYAEFLAAGVWRRGVPHARIRIDEQGLGMTCAQFVNKLHSGKPPIHPHEREVPGGNLIINPWGLVGDAPEIIVLRIKEIVAETQRKAPSGTYRQNSPGL